MNTSRFSWRSRARSFRYAWQGIKAFVAGEHNAWIHCAVTVVVIVAGVIFRIEPWEWVSVVLCIGGVLAAEGFNSSIEALCDKVSAAQDPLIGRAKDIAAGSVLIMAIAAVVVGMIVFLPKILRMI